MPDVYVGEHYTTTCEIHSLTCVQSYFILPICGLTYVCIHRPLSLYILLLFRRFLIPVLTSNYIISSSLSISIFVKSIFFYMTYSGWLCYLRRSGEFYLFIFYNSNSYIASFVIIINIYVFNSIFLPRTSCSNQ